jgi:hypothetical protein
MLPLRQRLTKRNSVLWCELEVGSATVCVYLVNPRSKSLPEMRANVGFCEQETGTILVSQYLQEEIAEQVLLHELMHQAIYSSGVPMPDDEDAEEKIVNPLASALYDVLKRNGLFLGPQRLLRQGS